MCNTFKTSLFIGYWLKQAHSSLGPETFVSLFLLNLAHVKPADAPSSGTHPPGLCRLSFYLLVSGGDVLKALRVDINPRH